MVDAAVEAGADAIKFQTFKTDQVISQIAPKARYQLKSAEDLESQLEMVRKLELPFDEFEKLYAYCQVKGISFLSTPFDTESINFLEKLGVSAFKIASGEITNIPFLAHIASKKRPLIVSTGMSNLGEIEMALDAIRCQGNRDIVLLHCVSSYPAKPDDVNLRAMQTMRIAFGVPVGYSDHTLGIEIPIAAVALGACIVEKHFTLDRNLSGPDHQASLEPAELNAMVRGIRTVERAIGDGIKRPTSTEKELSAIARRSLVAAADIPVGTILTEEMVAVKRPGTGLPPLVKPYLIGRTTRISIGAGELITLEMLS
jgi:N-acetylneuraminate synthase